MRRGLVRCGVVFGLVVSLVAALVAVAPVAGAKEVGAEDQIRAAYDAVLDRSLPMDDRVAALEDGDELRSTLREVDDLDQIMGMDVNSVDLHVVGARVHDGDAEVQLSVFVNLYMVTGWTGVARKIDGQWVVARATVCALLTEWTKIRCPGGPKRNKYRQWTVEPETRGGDAVIPLTFVDGGRADVVVPDDLPGEWQVMPHAELVLGDNEPVSVWLSPGRNEATQPVRTYDGGPGRPGVELDAMSGLVVLLDKWTANIYSENHSERERAQIARHLDGYTTSSGFPIIIPTGPLHFLEPSPETSAGVQLVKSALNLDLSRNPIELWYVDERGNFSALVAVTPGPCPDELQPTLTDINYHAEERCMPDGVGRVAVEGSDTKLVISLLDTVRIRNYRPPPRTIST